jgi:mRNA interferase MazF
MTKRGDIIVIDFPYSDGSGSKIRPSLVVQNDADNQRLRNTIVAMITGNVSHAHEPTQHLIDPFVHQGTGLSGPSVVKCSVLVTVDQTTILRTIGSLSNAMMAQIDACLKAALDLP